MKRKSTIQKKRRSLWFQNEIFKFVIFIFRFKLFWRLFIKITHALFFGDRHWKFYIKLLFIICMVLILFFNFIFSSSGQKKQIKVQLERPHQFNQTSRNHQILDTYYHRITQFLHQRNVSISSYLQINTTHENVQKVINATVSQLQYSHHYQLFNIKNDQELEHGCQKTCCWYKRKMHSFYNGEPGRSPTVLDRLSQIDMKLLADVHYGKLPVPDNIQLSKLTHDILPCLQNNTIIFVDTTNISRFFDEFHDKISVKYILMTGDSDISCPLNIADSHASLLDEIFAGKTNIIHWFAMNCDLGNNQQWEQSTIFSCIPQGISQWTNQRYFMQLAHGKDDSVYNTNLKTDDYWVLTSFNKEHRISYRQPLWKLSCKGRLKRISKCFYRSNVNDQWRHLIHLAQSKFVFSPPGFGMDCYRTWEALYFGSIPIILNSSINSIFDKLPVLIVNKYTEVHFKMLVNVYDNMTKQKYDYRRLYKGYWQQKINFYRNSPELIQYQYRKSK